MASESRSDARVRAASRSEARAKGRKAALLDTDVGQKTVGLPACVTLAKADRSTLVFIGSVEPVRGWRRVVGGTRVLADEADLDLVITNTSGLLAGPGRRLKADKIAAGQPDLLIAIGGGSALEQVISDHPVVPALRLTRSPAARRKTDAGRCAARQQAFRTLLLWSLSAGVRARVRPRSPAAPASGRRSGQTCR